MNKLAYLYTDEPSNSGLICNITDIAENVFNFYVYNGQWNGSYYNGRILIKSPYDDRFEDGIYHVEYDMENIPTWAKHYVKAIITKDKKKYNECIQGIYNET